MRLSLSVSVVAGVRGQLPLLCCHDTTASCTRAAVPGSSYTRGACILDDVLLDSSQRYMSGGIGGHLFIHDTLHGEVKPLELEQPLAFGHEFDSIHLAGDCTTQAEQLLE